MGLVDNRLGFFRGLLLLGADHGCEASNAPSGASQRRTRVPRATRKFGSGGVGRPAHEPRSIGLARCSVAASPGTESILLLGIYWQRAAALGSISWWSDPV